MTTRPPYSLLAASIASQANIEAGTVNKMLDAAGLRAAMPYTKTFFSSQQTITSGSTNTIAHGLGATPKLVLAFIECTSTQSPLTAGQFGLLIGFNNAANNPNNATLRWDGTNVYVDVSANGIQFNGTNLTNSNFRIRVLALG